MRAFAFGGIVKKRFFGICLFLFVLTAAAGCGRADGSVESSAAGEAGAAAQNMSAEAELQGELLALTLHGYCVSEVNAADLQALGEPAGPESAGEELECPAGPDSAGKDPEGPAGLESAAKALEALRRAMEENLPEQQYQGSPRGSWRARSTDGRTMKESTTFLSPREMRSSGSAGAPDRLKMPGKQKPPEKQKPPGKMILPAAALR